MAAKYKIVAGPNKSDLIEGTFFPQTGRGLKVFTFTIGSLQGDGTKKIRAHIKYIGPEDGSGKSFNVVLMDVDSHLYLTGYYEVRGRTGVVTATTQPTHLA